MYNSALHLFSSHTLFLPLVFCLVPSWKYWMNHCLSMITSKKSGKFVGDFWCSYFCLFFSLFVFQLHKIFKSSDKTGDPILQCLLFHPVIYISTWRLWSLPTVKAFRAQLCRETAELLLRHICELPNYGECQFQGTKWSTEQKWQPRLSRTLRSIVSVPFSKFTLLLLAGIAHCSAQYGSGWVKSNDLFRRSDQWTQPYHWSHDLQFSETFAISIALGVAEPKLQGPPLINCRRIFTSSSIHGRTVEKVLKDLHSCILWLHCHAMLW